MKFSLILLLLISSCAKLGYITEQGYQQLKLQMAGEENSKILNDPKVSQEVKRKILLVGDYKEFFYRYFSEKPTKIYSKTTMLDHEAVSYLVVASPHTEIRAHEFEFPFMGSFPYLGFLKKESAKSFAKKLREKENLVTWVRPVYAYSTLGYLEDRILSSFFQFDDVELAELVFHELFHTVFFIRDDVDLNENLANLYGKELLHEYFKGKPELEIYLKKEERKEVFSKRVLELIKILQEEFDKLGGFITDEKADILTKRFVEEVFKPDLRSLCQQLKLSEDDCEIKDHWNQASFAAFLTYEEEQDFLYALKAHQKLNLKEFLSWLKSEYKVFKKQDKVEHFTDYLKLKVPDETSTPN
ncbi:MAG: aminopeptidase [Bacteriovoracaceae bacterium]